MCLGLVITIYLGKLKLMCKLTLVYVAANGTGAQRALGLRKLCPAKWALSPNSSSILRGRGGEEGTRKQCRGGKKKKKINVEEKTKNRDIKKSVVNYFYVFLCVKMYCLCCENTPHELIVFGQTLRSTWSSSFDLMTHKNMKILNNISFTNDAFIDKNKGLMQLLALLKTCFL